MRITVLGAGAWGTALADMLARSGHDVALWARDPDQAAAMAERRENAAYLPDAPLAEGLAVTSDAECAAAHVSARPEGEPACLLAAVPSQFLRGVLKGFRPLLPAAPVVVCASKGIELDTLAPMSRVVAESLGADARYAALSGPSFAAEVARGLPTAVSLGCADEALGHTLRQALSTPRFRVYSTTDHLGVELGGAVKNVMAIAAGISDGLGFGHNARAGIITRGLAEMARLGRAMGARAETLNGLSGMGDLVLTCTGDLSRNRQVGLRLGKGETPDAIAASMRAVAEGVKTTRSLHALAARLGVDLPITCEVYAVLYEDKDPARGVTDLMGRELKDEHA